MDFGCWILFRMFVVHFEVFCGCGEFCGGGYGVGVLQLDFMFEVLQVWVGLVWSVVMTCNCVLWVCLLLMVGLASVGGCG